MDIFRIIAERLITEAIERGEFENLEGSGKPLKFEEEAHIPEDLRIAYKILKNAGFAPPELELKKEIINMKDLINSLDDDKERLKKIRELNFKIMKLNMMRKRPLNLEEFPLYEEKLLNKMIKDQP
ncbi:MAG: DUF1992 domain-containing protein [Thermodesulfovibrionales bacterium]|nr:DUF1992 domain-containing protein [Thermodesulfovibrionales bacterium]